MHILAAMSIGAILVVAAIIGVFVWLNRRVDEKRDA
jgi:nitrate reductase gamma subunit